MSIVRENLMNKPGYTPYCGNEQCTDAPRTWFWKGQFVCPVCGWRSSFEEEFINKWKEKWNIG